jgi:hypothetical protein
MRSLPFFESKKSLLYIFALSLVLGLAIVYGVKGWRTFFFTGMAAHWDPEIMGEWMAWNAHNILHGQFLVPDFQANFFYPHSYTLAFGEMLWPESFVYALFYFLTGNLSFTFNATMLFFWILSGVLLFVLLRMLDVSVLVSALGSLVYCLMPYRMPYYVEFNMVLVFVFPLMMIVLLNWLRAPSLKTALGFCLGYFLSATSCIYFTIMAIIVMMFVFVAFVNHDRSLLRSRGFYVSGGVIIAGVLAISALYLYPYALLHIEGGYERSTADYLKYFAQPMQYLDTGDAALLRWMHVPAPRFSETFLSPGTALALLFLLFLAYRCITFVRRYSSLGRPLRYVGIAKFVLWTVFWSVILVQEFYGPVRWLKPYNRYLYEVALLLIALYIAGLFLLDDKQRTPGVLLAGLATAAVLCFFISFGPFISVGTDADRVVLARGPFLDLQSWNPLFNAVRALTRFAIVVMTYLTIAGCCAADRMVRNNQWTILALPLIAAISLYEARVMIPYKFFDPAPILNSRVMNEAQHLPEPYVLFQLPVANRDSDANLMMSSIGEFPLLANGWSGFAPKHYWRFFSLQHKKWEIGKFLPWVGEIWPRTYLIVDRSWIYRMTKGWRKPFPWDELNRRWEMIDQDNRYALYRQKKVVHTSGHIVKRVRTDVLRKHPVLFFRARSSGSSPVDATILLNHLVAKEKIRISGAWKEYTVRLPASDTAVLTGNEIDINMASSSDAGSWEVKDIEFKADER